MTGDPRVAAAVAAHPYPLVFATISGALLYGFASPDSDVDIRGVHVLPARELLGLRPARETIEQSGVREGLEIDLVTHDARKFAEMLLKKNGYVLEQLASPLVVRTSPGHAELRALVPGLVTRHHAHHYLGFARTQWALFEKEPRVKPLLYVYRVLLTGIHLMRAGEVEANLPRLNGTFRLPFIDDLIAQKTREGAPAAVDRAFHEREVARLTAELEAARVASSLPEAPSAFDALDAWLARVRG